MNVPEPGDRAPAPEPLRLVQRFVNTTDLEDDVDAIADPAALAAWLADAGVLPAGSAVSPAEHARALRLREAIRDLAGGDAIAATAVDSAARGARLRPVIGAGLALEPEAEGFDAALGRLVAPIYLALADGSWERLKACERSSCRWLFYDASRNRSGHWCSMATCGAREKNRRAYRRRRDRSV
jgi:predicted RNA-binding Zn ribbon-like protein